MSIYGIELLDHNVAECRENLLDVFADYLGVSQGDEWCAAATSVLAVNIVHGDALSMTTQGPNPQPITFAEWSYLGKGRFHLRDFRFDTLTQMSSFGEADTLFADLGKHGEIASDGVSHFEKIPRRGRSAGGESPRHPPGAVVARNDTRYIGGVIVSFRHKGLERLYRDGSKKGVQPAHVPKLLRILSALDVAQVPDDLAIPSFRTHQLKGDLAGHWSVWVNGNWRVTFRFIDGDVELVDYQDYH